MVTRKNKYAGKCFICRKYITWDDFQVTKDLTAVAIRPAFMAAHDGKDECPGHGSVNDLVESLLKDKPVCPKCWHEVNADHPLAAGAMRAVETGIIDLALPPDVGFVWTRVR